MKPPIFTKLGLSEFPIILAPLAGVSDHPFRRMCSREGAELTYVEMLSALALLRNSSKTLQMMQRHPVERILGVQLTGRNAGEVARAVEILDRHSFEVIDINMGCPVKKVVKIGAGSAILRDPERVAETVRQAGAATGKPVTVKIRLGWDRQSINAVEVAQAAEAAGAAWITVHGRTRSDDYSVPVDLERMAEVKRSVRIPVIGNGNIFSRQDAEQMRRITSVDGIMVSRGALGNPWIFRELAGDSRPITRDEWLQGVLDHLRWQEEAYGDSGLSAVCMRKHLLWYASGWPGARRLREQINNAESLAAARAMIEDFAEKLQQMGITERLPLHASGSSERFVWNPKWDMDRQHDRGVGVET